MRENTVSYESLHSFEMTVKYMEDEAAPEHSIGSHMHSECEIYVHLDGDVSFMVEDQLYPIRYGNIVITRPNEYHHCIYHTRTRHRHFWILFSADNNERILKTFFGRQKGKGNLLALGSEQTEELIALCYSLCGEPKSEVEKYYCFFKMLRLFEQAEDVGEDSTAASNELSLILRYVHRNYAERLTVGELAEIAHISVSTLERLFDTSLGMTPSEYVRKIRLANVSRLLAEKHSVTEAAELSGFSDVSAMISFFKKQYGVTPLRYKRRKELEKLKK